MVNLIPALIDSPISTASCPKMVAQKLMMMQKLTTNIMYMVERVGSMGGKRWKGYNTRDATIL